MMLDLDRDHALFDSELPVGVTTGGGVDEEERVLTVRLLMGTRVPAAALARDKRPAYDGGGAPASRLAAAATSAASGYPPSSHGASSYGAASYGSASYASPRGAATTERPPERSGRERVLHLELCDADDPYFLYSLDVGETDFHDLRREHGILVDFGAFPKHFIELLARCAASDAAAEGDKDSFGGASKFSVALERPSDAATGAAKFAVIEANRFKRVTHVALSVAAGDDAAVKAYLAGRLIHVAGGAARCGAELDACQLDVLELRDEAASLKESLAEARDALRRGGTDRDGERLQESAAAREALARETTDLRASHAAELRNERDRANAEADDLKRKLASATQARDASAAADSRSSASLRETEASLQRSEAARVSAQSFLETERAARLQASAERDAAEAARHGVELQLAAVRQRAADADGTVARADELRRAADDARSAAAASLASLQAQLHRREEQLACASAEIKKGNGIIDQLSEHSRAAQAKLRLKTEVIRQQEKRLDAEKRSADDAAHKTELAENALAREREKRCATGDEANAARKKLAEAADLLANNQQVISWLNQELHEHQLGRRGGAGAFAADARLAPSVVSPPLRTQTHHENYDYAAQADSAHDRRRSGASPSPQKRQARPPDAGKPAADNAAVGGLSDEYRGESYAYRATRPRDAAEAYFEEYGAFNAAEFHEHSSTSFDLASQVYAVPKTHAASAPSGTSLSTENSLA